MSNHDRGVLIPSPLLILLALAAAGCFGRSAASVQAEFETYVAGANACATATDCTIVYADCPLGCVVSVRVDRAADVQRKAAELVADYRAGGGGCVYDCIGPVEPVCTAAGRC